MVEGGAWIIQVRDDASLDRVHPGRSRDKGDSLNSQLASPSGDLFLALMALSFPEALICSGPSSSLILLDTLPLSKAGLGKAFYIMHPACQQKVIL